MEDDSILAKIMAYLRKNSGGEDIYIPDEEVRCLISKYEKLTGSKVTFNESGYSAATISVSATIGMVQNIWNGTKVLAQSFYAFSNGNEDDGGKCLRDYGFQLLTGTSVSIFAEAAIVTFSIANPWAALAILIAASVIGTELGNNLSDLYDTIFDIYDDAGAYTYPVDPLIFDLNGDGVKTVALADGVHFDFDKNGFAEKIGWVSAEDGLLVRDLDKNGKIDSGRELMGDLTELSDEMTASNGFEAPAYFDANADGVVDAKDDIYNELQIWQDKNQNGVVDAGEIMSLSEAGIASINLAYENIDVRDGSGNGHSQRGTYTKTDGTTSTVEDVWFEKDAANTVVSDTIDKNVLEETDEIAGLPDIQGKGNQYSLHQAGVYLEEVAEMFVA